MSKSNPGEESDEADAEVVDSPYRQQDDNYNIVEASFHTGPLPHPITLEQYNRILSDAANRIVSMAEREQEHRHRMQEKLVNAQVDDIKQERNERRLDRFLVFRLVLFRS